jgi:Zn-dependent M16 (insulinase) family peptidase
MAKLFRLARGSKNLMSTRSKMLSSQFQANQELGHGWKVIRSIAVPELNLTNAVHLKHSHCNAQWLHMENLSDDTNAFSVHFKTVPRDSTGVAHILEHVTLCGSQRYPVRDPFMKMLNRSVQFNTEFFFDTDIFRYVHFSRIFRNIQKKFY